MIITHPIEIDLVNPGAAPRVQVKQGESLSRMVEVRLLQNGEAWAIPSGTQVAIRYHVHDLDGAEDSTGIYDTLPNGSIAYQYTQNIVQFVPLPQMLARHGLVSTDLVLTIDGMTLATCNIEFYVNRAPNNGTGAGAADYYRVMSLDQINAALDTLRSDVDNLLQEVAYLTGVIDGTN